MIVRQDSQYKSFVPISEWLPIQSPPDLRNKFTQAFTEMQERGAPVEELYWYRGEHTMYQALVQGDIEEGEMPCGQNAGIITGLTSSADVIQSIIADLPSVTKAMQDKLPYR